MAGVDFGQGLPPHPKDFPIFPMIIELIELSGLITARMSQEVSFKTLEGELFHPNIRHLHVR